MANINEIQALAKKLNLQNMSKKEFGLAETDMSNLDFLEIVLRKELELRAVKRELKNLKESKMPKKELDFSRLSESAKWQIEELIKNGLQNERNLIITGSCKTGKTALAAYLSVEAIKKGLKAYYIKQDLLIEVLYGVESEPKCKAIWSRLKSADVIIIDEILYTNITTKEINLLYKALVFLNETRKLIFITNRDIAEWLTIADDKHLMQTFIDRLLYDAEMLRTNRVAVSKQ